MSIQEFGALGEGIGSLLILITLIYLAMQNRYQQKLLLSHAYQARTDTIIRMLEWGATNPSVAARAVKLNNDEELTEEEHEQWASTMLAYLRSIENGHFQHSLGVVSDEYGKTLQAMVRSLIRTERSLRLWSDIRVIFRASFADFVDSIIQEIEQEEAAA
jgi:hypothetical protein